MVFFWTIRIADYSDVTLTLRRNPCRVNGNTSQPGIELGSGSKLTIRSPESYNNNLLIDGKWGDAILGPTDSETPATVILNSGIVQIHSQSSSGISGNVNLVINGGDFKASGKTINVQSLIVTGGELWAGNTIATYCNRVQFKNIICNQGILPYDSDKQNILCVFGALTLPVDLTIPDGKTLDLHSIDSLTIPEDRSLTCNMLQIVDKATLTNKGTLTINQKSRLSNDGTLKNEGTLIINDELSINRTNALTNTGTISGSGSIEPRLNQDKPASLTVKRIENGAVTLEADGQGKTDLEYSKDGTTWQVSPTFTGVDLSAGCTFSARYKADGQFYQASAPASLTFCPVKLDANGGTIASGKDVAYYIVGQGVTLPAKDGVKRPGYTFAGWYANAALTGSPVAAIGADATERREYWAGGMAVPASTSPEESRTITVYEGERATMRITAQHAAAYQWRMSTDGGASWADCGTDSPAYTTAPAKLADDGTLYQCTVTGSGALEPTQREELPPEGAQMSLRSRSRSTDDAAKDPLTAESPIFTLKVIRKDALPQTGDSSRLAGWLALLGACCAGLWCAGRRRG